MLLIRGTLPIWAGAQVGEIFIAAECNIAALTDSSVRYDDWILGNPRFDVNSIEQESTLQGGY